MIWICYREGMKGSPRSQLSKLLAKLGSRGGKVRAQILSAKRRKEIAHKAAQASAAVRRRKKKVKKKF
jgi:hypothetical protein